MAGQLGPYICLLRACSPKTEAEPAGSPSSTPFLEQAGQLPGHPHLLLPSLHPRGELRDGVLASLQPSVGRGHPIQAPGPCSESDLGYLETESTDPARPVGQ